MSCAFLSQQQQLAPQTSSCSYQNKAGTDSCCPREGERHSRRVGQARCYSKCVQCSSVIVKFQENQISWLPSLCFLSTLPPAFTPSAGSGLDARWGSVPWIMFSNCCPIYPMPNWRLPLSRQLRLRFGEPGMSSRMCLVLLWLSDTTETRKLWSPAETCLPPLSLFLGKKLNLFSR